MGHRAARALAVVAWCGCGGAPDTPGDAVTGDGAVVDAGADATAPPDACTVGACAPICVTGAWPRLIEAGQEPRRIVVADFDGDGRDDWVAAAAAFTLGGYTLSFARGRGDGTFDDVRVQEIPTLPGELAAGDFDEDGDVDLAIARSTDEAHVAVYTNDGSGGFAAGSNSPIFWARVDALEVVDVDRDGHLDVAVTGETYARRGAVSLLYGRGDGSFEPYAAIQAAVTPYDVAVADIDADGVLDLISTEAAEPRGVHVQRGLGGRRWAATVFTPVPGVGWQRLAVRDFDGDADADVVTADLLGSVDLLTSRGDGTLAAPVSIADLEHVTDVLTDDLDGDRRPDVIAFAGGPLGGAYEQVETLVVLRNRGDGFEAARHHAAGAPLAAATGDFDRDGARDVVTTNSGTDAATVFRGTGNGALVTPERFPLAVNPRRILAADLDGDGRDDVVFDHDGAADASRDTGVDVARAGVDGLTEPVQYDMTVVAQQTPYLGDVNGDGVPDLLATGGGIAFRPGRGDASFGDERILDRNASPNRLWTADLDVDGHRDLAVLDSRGLQVLYGDGTGAIAAVARVVGWTGIPATATRGDLDRDGIDDIAVAERHGASQMALFFFGRDRVWRRQLLDIGAPISAAAAGDLDGDGALDLVVTTRVDSGPHTLTVWRGDGHGAFAAGDRIELLGDHGDLVIEVVDVDGDGDLDVTAFDRLGRLHIVDGDGRGRLGAPASFSVVGDDMAIADIDADGAPDVVATGRKSMHLTVLRGRCRPR